MANRRRNSSFNRGNVCVLLCFAIFGTKTADAAAQAVYDLPFPAGEELTYRLRAGRLGTVGTGTLKVDGPVNLRGTATLVLHSEMRSTLPLIRGTDRTVSWIDPNTFQSLRFEKHERTPLASIDRSVDIFGSERRWAHGDGRSGVSASEQPLDELSFIYFIRTLPLVPGTVISFERHFDTTRNPVTVRVLKREVIRVGAGEFGVTLVEMRVRDPERFEGETVIRIHLSDDACRLPIRIESAMPLLGTTVLTLESHNHPPEHFRR